MSTKIQINSLEALERLIGNDTQLETEIRNNVVQDFAAKHLKAVANSPAVTNAISTMSAALKEQTQKKLTSEIATFTESWSGHISNVKFVPAVQSELERLVRLKIDSEIARAVESAMTTWATDANRTIEQIVEKRVAYLTEQHIRDKVSEKLKSVLKTV
jgi:hypothetical protein